MIMRPTSPAGHPEGPIAGHPERRRRDIAGRRDRTGTLEGTLTTLMNARCA